MKRNGITYERGQDAVEANACGAITVHRKDSSAKLLESFLGWLLTRGRQADMPGGGRTFRRKTARFWETHDAEVRGPEEGRLRRRHAPGEEGRRAESV